MIEISLGLILAAFVAGVLMFLAPCTLPIVPAYLAFIAGVSKQSAAVGVVERARIRRSALYFVSGFGVTFVAMGALAGYLGTLIAPWQSLISQVGGALIIFFGLMVLGLFRLPVLSRSLTLRPPRFLTPGNPSAAATMGVVFALGWTPCVGPVLATVLVVASTSGAVLSGIVLLGAFGLGLAIPFLLVAFLYARVAERWQHWTGFFAFTTYVGGVLLILLGLILLTQNFGVMVAWGTDVLTALGLDWLYNWY